MGRGGGKGRKRRRERDGEKGRWRIALRGIDAPGRGDISLACYAVVTYEKNRFGIISTLFRCFMSHVTTSAIISIISKLSQPLNWVKFNCHQNLVTPGFHHNTHSCQITLIFDE